MNYTEVKQGRTFYVRIDHGEDPRDVLHEFCIEKNIGTAWFQMFGAVANGRFVVGPVEDSIPSTPVFKNLKRPSELLAFGSILPGSDGQPDIHLHSAAGNEDKVIVGCHRGESNTFQALEVILIELLGGKISRQANSMGVDLPCFMGE